MEAAKEMLVVDYPKAPTNRTQFKPLGKFVLIQRDEPKEKTEGGIIIAETAKKKRHGRGKILDMGAGHYCEKGNWVPAPRHLIGSRVVFSEMAPVQVGQSEERLVVCTYDQVFCVTTEEEGGFRADY